MNRRFLSICGVIAPVEFGFMTILGGAIRPGYSHISDTVSELFSPGAPNKSLMDPIFWIYSILLVLFGLGILQFVRSSEHTTRFGIAGAWLYIAMGLVTMTIATVFPQDAWGSPPTFDGQMHIILGGVIGLLFLLSMSLIGIWFYRSKIFPGFGVFSFIDIGVVLLLTGVFTTNWGSPIMGLTERIVIFSGFLWTFSLALWMVKREGSGSLKVG